MKGAKMGLSPALRRFLVVVLSLSVVILVAAVVVLGALIMRDQAREDRALAVIERQERTSREQTVRIEELANANNALLKSLEGALSRSSGNSAAAIAQVIAEIRKVNAQHEGALLQNQKRMIEQLDQILRERLPGPQGPAGPSGPQGPSSPSNPNCLLLCP